MKQSTSKLFSFTIKGTVKNVNCDSLEAFILVRGNGSNNDRICEEGSGHKMSCKIDAFYGNPISFKTRVEQLDGAIC